MRKVGAEFAPEFRLPGQLSRREWLVGAGLVTAEVYALKGAIEGDMKGKEILREQLRTPRGHNPELRRISDQKQEASGSRVTNPLAEFNLGVQLPNGAHHNPDTFPYPDNQRGVLRLVTSGAAVPMEVSVDGAAPTILSLTRESAEKVAATPVTIDLVSGKHRRDVGEVSVIDTQVRPIEQPPAPLYSETLIDELVNPEVNVIDGQGINAVIANRDPKDSDGVANVWWGLFGNRLSEGASLLRVAEIAHQNPKSRTYGFDPLAHGESDGLNHEQKADLKKGDFRSSVRPFLKLLKEKGETKVRLFGSSLGATMALTAASIAKEEFDLDVEVVGVYGMPMQDPSVARAERPKDGMERVLEFFYGAQTAELMKKDIDEGALLDFAHSHPLDPRLITMERMDDSPLALGLHSVAYNGGQILKNPGMHYAHGLARVTPEDAIAMGSKFVADNEGGNIYFHTGSEDTVSPTGAVREIVTGIRSGKDRSRRRVTQQIRSGENHLSLVQPLELGADIARNSQPLAA